MSIAVLILLTALSASIAFWHGDRSAGETKRARTVGFALGLLVLLFLGLWVSGRAGNEPAAYGFGIAIALALAIMLVAGIASAVGRALRRRKDRD